MVDGFVKNEKCKYARAFQLRQRFINLLISEEDEELKTPMKSKPVTERLIREDKLSPRVLQSSRSDTRSSCGNTSVILRDQVRIRFCGA